MKLKKTGWFAVLSCSALLWLPAAAAGAGESSGWRLGPTAWSFNRFTLFEAIDKTAALGMTCLEAFTGQTIRPDDPRKLEVDLPDEVAAQIRAKLAAAKVQLTSLYLHQLPGEEAACRQSFEFARKLGAGFIVSEPEPAALDVIEKCCREYGIKLAIHNHAEGVSRYWHPREVLKVCAGRGPLVGACADTGHWMRSGLDPAEAIQMLGSRLLAVHLKDLNQPGRDGHDVPWGTGQGNLAGVLRAVQRSGARPALWGIEYEAEWDNNSPSIARCATFFQRTTNELAAELVRELPLKAGWARVDITPPKPVALVGQLHKRISQGVQDPLTATVLALETTGPGGAQAILVSCDVCMIQKPILDRLRERLQNRLAGFDVRQLVLNATHTHTGPGFLDSTFKGLYDVSKDPGVMSASEYGNFFIDTLAPVIAEAWQKRQPAALSWALGQAVVGVNRRTHFFNGTNVLYGAVDNPGFANFEGGDDHNLGVICFWTPEKELSGMIINLPCPSQETEGLSVISADFWHEVRLELWQRYSPRLFILPQCAAAGDLSPHVLLQRRAEDLMDQRQGLSRRQSIARRIARAVAELMPCARADLKTSLVFQHTMAALDLPEKNPPATPFYETDSVHPAEFHYLRLGEVALATVPFELFHDYGQRIQARSRATLTLTQQLTAQNCGYLPTETAVQGGGYSADAFIVGPEGGQVLVEESIRRLNALWPDPPGK
jgi:sugar phosphate isomerase/epimerase